MAQINSNPYQHDDDYNRWMEQYAECISKGIHGHLLNYDVSGIE
jgi:hypothetical protein